jgi:hypothetical protein
VLVIATVVISIAIPKIRTINQERNIREAARVVGSAFANASQRSSIDGVAGVRITRNQNYDQGGFKFAATEISLLRKVPNYTGDVANSQITASDAGAGTVTIPRPIEQDELGIIEIGDTISFSNSSFRYRITGPTPLAASGPLVLELDRGEGDYMPIPAFDGTSANNPTYVIQRLPRLLRSSLSELPEGYIVDLRFSGFEVLDEGDASVFPAIPPQLTTVFEPLLTLSGIDDYEIDVVFDGEGAIDRVFYRDRLSGNTVATRIPLGPLYFYVTEAPESFEMTDEVASASESGLWVSVSNSTGSTNIGYNNSSFSLGFTYQGLTDYYNGPYDADNDPEMDRDHFNEIIENSRDKSLSSSANQ